MREQFEVNIVDGSPLVVFLIFSVPLLLGLGFLRCGPCGEVSPNVSVAVSGLECVI